VNGSASDPIFVHQCHDLEVRDRCLATSKGGVCWLEIKILSLNVRGLRDLIKQLWL